MIAFESHHRKASRAVRAYAPAVALLCLLLLAVLSFAQVAHVHSNQSDADHCTLCIVMHTLAPATLAVAAIVLVPLGLPAPVFEPAAVLHRRACRLYIRPPPTGC